MQIVWAILLGLSLIIGWEGPFELRYGEWLIPILSGVMAVVLVTMAFALKGRRSQITAWTKLSAISGIVGACVAYAAATFTDDFECVWGGCTGLVNNFFGYACGEWYRGCWSEWFTAGFLFAVLLLSAKRFCLGKIK